MMFLEATAGGRMVEAVVVIFGPILLVAILVTLVANYRDDPVKFRWYVVTLLSQPLVLVRDFKEAFQQRKR